MDHFSLTHSRQRIEKLDRRFDEAFAQSLSPRAFLLSVMFLGVLVRRCRQLAVSQFEGICPLQAVRGGGPNIAELACAAVRQATPVRPPRMLLHWRACSLFLRLS